MPKEYVNASLHFGNTNPKDKRLIKQIRKEFGDKRFHLKKDKYGDEVLVPNKGVKKWRELIKKFDDSASYKLATDSFYQGVVKGIGMDDIGTALGLGAAAYGIHKVNKGIANKLQKSFPKIHNIPKHAISGGLTGALLGGVGGAALAHGLSTIYGKPPVWAISPIMAGLLGAHGAAAGAYGGALKNYITSLLNPSKKKKSAKDANDIAAVLGKGYTIDPKLEKFLNTTKQHVYWNANENNIVYSKLNQKQMTKEAGRGFLEIDRNPNNYKKSGKFKYTDYWLPDHRTVLNVIDVPHKDILKDYPGAIKLKV